MKNFEERVLDTVSSVLVSGESAEFFNGTLFVQVNKIDRSRCVGQSLKSGEFGDMIVNWTGDEYIVDFV